MNKKYNYDRETEKDFIVEEVKVKKTTVKDQRYEEVESREEPLNSKADHFIEDSWFANEEDVVVSPPPIISKPSKIFQVPIL